MQFDTLLWVLIIFIGFSVWYLDAALKRIKENHDRKLSDIKDAIDELQYEFEQNSR